MFSNKYAFITGGTRGIGRAIAFALADLGCHVIATGLTEEEIEQFDPAGRSVEPRQLDVTDAKAVKKIVAGLDRLDILINAAGTILHGGREHIPSGFAKVLDVNLTGTMRLCAACRHLLAETNGCVVNIASMLSFFGNADLPAYSASKGGVVLLTRSLAIAWADSGVRVNAIAPGWVETAMTEPLRNDPAGSAEILRRTPLGRWAQPEDIAGPTLFLCSPAAAFVTGVVLPVDGGYGVV